MAGRCRWLLLPLGLTALNATLWTIYATLGGNVVLHGDSAEAYAWGREFQLGYYKHPPFWSWIAGAWFSLFPHTDWAFYLLSEANASLGVLGTWVLLGRFTQGPARLAGTLLLLLTTFYTFNALRFNANTIQLSIWPWTMYFLVLSIEKKTMTSGAVLGLFAGLAILSKYYTALLLVSCLAAAMVHRDRQRYFQSPAPWIAILVLGMLITPHFVWVAQNSYQPFIYAIAQSERPDAKFVDSWAGFLVICVLYHVLQSAVILAVKLRQKPRAEFLPAFDIQHGAAFLSVLALGPFVLTLLFGLVGYRVTPLYIIPIFSLTPFLLLFLTGADARGVARSCAWVYGVIVTVCLIAAPFVPYITMRTGGTLQPLRQVSLVAVDEWKKTIQAPLHLVSGSLPYSEALAFYAPGDVSEFRNFNFKFAPWVTEQRVKDEGLLVVCLTEDHQCLGRAEHYKTVNTRTVETTIVPTWGELSGAEVAFTIIMIPPEGQG